MVTYIVTESNNQRPNINCNCQRHKPVPVVLAFNPGLLGCYQQFKPWSLNVFTHTLQQPQLVQIKLGISTSENSQIYTIYSM